MKRNEFGSVNQGIIDMKFYFKTLPLVLLLVGCIDLSGSKQVADNSSNNSSSTESVHYNLNPVYDINVSNFISKYPNLNAIEIGAEGVATSRVSIGELSKSPVVRVGAPGANKLIAKIFLKNGTVITEVIR